MSSKDSILEEYNKEKLTILCVFCKLWIMRGWLDAFEEIVCYVISV